MAQYKTGTASVTNGSATVTGTGTAFSANLTPGNLFTVAGDDVAYTIASAPTATSLTLTAPYSGITGSGKTYGVTIDFTPDMGLPLMSIGDLNTAAIYNEAMKNIDNLNLDGLGTAAFADLTTSSDDETAGRALKVGDFGIGSVIALGSDDFLQIRSGKFQINENGSTNTPFTSASGFEAFICEYDKNGSDFCIVTATSTRYTASRNRRFIATYSSDDGWSAWKEL